MKKLISLFVMCCLLLCLVPGLAFASDETGTEPTPNYEASVTAADGTVTNYEKFDEALDAAEAEPGSTVTLLKNINQPLGPYSEGSFTLDLNGKTLTLGPAMTVTSNSELHIKDSSEAKTGKIQAGKYNAFELYGNKLYLEGGTFIIPNNNNSPFIKGSGTVVLNGHFKFDPYSPMGKLFPDNMTVEYSDAYIDKGEGFNFSQADKFHYTSFYGDTEIIPADFVEVSPNTDGTHSLKCKCGCGTDVKTENCNFAYTAAANVITAKCQTEGCGASYTLSLEAPENLVYDGNAKEVTVVNNIPGFPPNGEQLVVTYSGYITNVTEDGFSASLTVGMESNTATAVLTGIKIQPAPISADKFTLTPASFEYNAEVQNPTVSSALSENDYTMGEIPQSVDAGTYEIPVTGMGNYTGEAKLQYLINPKPITITANNQTINYGGNHDTKAIEPVLDLLEGHTLASVTVKANDHELIPSAAIIKDADGKDVTANYSITYEKGILTFNKVTPTITAEKKLVCTSHDGAKLYLYISLAPVENGEAPSGEIELEIVGRDTAHSVLPLDNGKLNVPNYNNFISGEYELKITYGGDKNYAITTYSEKFTIDNDKMVPLVISDVSPAPAGEPLELSCGDEVDNSKVTYEVVSGDATINGSTLTADNPGKVTIKAYKAADENSYAAESAEKEINITAPLAKLDPEAPDGENGWYKSASLIAPEGYTISTELGGPYSSSISFPEGTTAELTYYLKDISDASLYYTFPGTVKIDGTAPVISCTSGDITENSAIITASATDSGSGFASSSLSYVSGGSGEPTIEKAGDKYNISGMEPGTGYVFIFTAKDNAGNTAEQNISVVTRPVIPSGLSGVYGDKLSTVTLPEGWSWQDAGIMSKTGEQKYAATHNSGAYPYLVPVNVLPRELTVPYLDAVDRAYDGTTSVSLKNGELIGLYVNDDVQLDLSNAVAQMADANVGANKAVTISKLELTGADKDNYTLTIPTDVKVNISAKSVTPTVSLSTGSFTYSGKEHRPTVSLKDGASTIDPANYTVTYSYNVKVGQATATIEPKAGGNYVFDNQIKPFVIDPAELSIGPRPLRVYRGSAVPTLEMVISGLISGDTVSLDPAPLFRIYDRSGNEVTAAQAVKTVGSYTIRWVNAENSSLSGQDSGNYHADIRSEARLTVLAPPVTNSGSTGGGYYAPAPAATSTPGISVSISGDDKTIYASAKLSGSTAIVDKVDLSKLDTVIGTKVKTGTVTVDFSRNTAGKNIDTVEIPADAVKKIANAVADSNNDADALEIVLSKGRSIEFDGVALAEKVRQAGGEDITISIEHADTVDTLTPEQKNAIGYRDAYEINVWSGGRHISGIGGKIHVHLPYQLRAGEDAAGLRVYYVDEKGQRELCESSYDSASQHIRFVTDHLSLYMIDYEAPAAVEPEETPAVTAPVSTEAPAAEQLPEAEENGFSGLFLWLILLLVAVVGLGLAAWLLIRKKLK